MAPVPEPEITRDAKVNLGRYVGATRTANERLEDSRGWYEDKVRKPFASGR